MAVLKILKDGDPLLRQKAQPIVRITKKLHKLVQDMYETMEDASGVGLAAPQVGVSKRLILVDVDDELIVIINPQIIQFQGEITDVEGCLSVPGINGYVNRSAQVQVVGFNEQGKKITVTGEGLLARALQHEIDHLDGILFTDKILAIPEEEGE